MSIKNYLTEHIKKHPSLMPQDVVKLCYQAAFGAEHLLSDLSAAKRYFDLEFDGVEPSATERVLSVRDAMLSASAEIAIENVLGEVLASASVSCPPAVPILIAGERIDENAIECFRYYGIDKVRVVR